MKQIFNLRKESFGATLFSVCSGRRTYVTNKESEIILNGGQKSLELLNTLGMQGELIARLPERLPTDNFSSPDTVFMEVTRACNLRCKHCFNNSGVKLSSELGALDRVRILKNLAQSGVQEVRYTGGEPTLVRDLINLAFVASSNGGVDRLACFGLVRLSPYCR